MLGARKPLQTPAAVVPSQAEREGYQAAQTSALGFRVNFRGLSVTGVT